MAIKLPPLKSKRLDVRYLLKQALNNPNKKTRRYYLKLYQREIQNRQIEIINRKFYL